VVAIHKKPQRDNSKPVSQLADLGIPPQSFSTKTPQLIQQMRNECAHQHHLSSPQFQKEKYDSAQSPITFFKP
jgi:hypothetical protein